MLKMIIIQLMVLLASATAGCERRQEPIKIGLAINLSGRGGEAGEQIRDGALLAVEEINARGGVKGRPLILLVRDDENSDEGIQRADQSLLDEKVVVIIGHSYSANTVKAYPLITGNNTLMITGYTATTSLTGKDDLFFRTAIDCQVYGQKTAALLKKKGVTSLSLLMDMSNSDFVLDYAKQVERNFQGPMAMVQFESRANVDWQGITDELLAPGPGAILMLTEASMTAVGVQYVRNQGFSGPVIGTIWTQSPGLLKAGGPASEGMSIVSFIDPDNQRPDYLQFSTNLEKKFNKSASARSSRAYEMIAILAAGLQKAEKINAQALKTALLEGEFESILGTLRFDQYGDVARPVCEVVVKEGKFINGGEIL